MFLSTPPSRVATRRRPLSRPHRPRFYPRHPRGWRCGVGDSPPLYFVFLSTPPSRVATRLFLRPAPGHRRFYPRHPRGWRPAIGEKYVLQQVRFYPRHPRGWRPAQNGFAMLIQGVSIHATLAGGDPRYQLTTDGPPVVSIHATLAGGDGGVGDSPPLYFVFLSTPPSRVATAKTRIQTTILLCFYPRHPRGWRQRSQGCSEAHHFWFLSTPPSRVATCGAIYGDSTDNVSIHATLAGGD